MRLSHVYDSPAYKGTGEFSRDREVDSSLLHSCQDADSRLKKGKSPYLFKRKRKHAFFFPFTLFKTESLVLCQVFSIFCK